jgi:hypothetical protein
MSIRKPWKPKKRIVCPKCGSFSVRITGKTDPIKGKEYKCLATTLRWHYFWVH